MSHDLPCVSYMALYIISIHIINTNSRTSTHWKLNAENGKVQAAAMAASGEENENDPLMSILTSRVNLDNGEWRLDSNPRYTVNHPNKDKEEILTEIPKKTNDTRSSTDSRKTNSSTSDKLPKKKNISQSNGSSSPSAKKSGVASNKSTRTSKTEPPKKTKILDCGRIANYTQFDHLPGVAERHNHPLIPEPDVALIFKDKSTKTGSPEVDMNNLEKRLRKLKKDKPKSAQVYNQIGNFWRIRGNTLQSIECFRKALSISPNNSDVLLNLARVLFNLEYLDDAIELTRQSLQMQSPDQNSWLQYFTLGEILKAYGKYAEAAIHFKQTLELKPDFHAALVHLQEIEINPDVTFTYYTLFIILFLVLGVLCGILTSVDSNFEEMGETIKTQRHFNRAMAMRSIKLGINHKVIRMRKQGYSC